MAEQRRRFLRRRQTYLVWLLMDLTLNAYERFRMVHPGRGKVTAADLQAVTPDISPEDNGSLASAAGSLVGSLEGVQRLLGGGEAFRAMSLRLFAKFVGETLGQDEVDAVLEEGAAEMAKRESGRGNNLPGSPKLPG